MALRKNRPDLTPIGRFPDLEKPGMFNVLQALNFSLLTTKGDILYRGTTYPQRLPIGSTDQVLTIAGGVPIWAAPAAGTGNVATDAIWDGKGDLAVGIGADAAQKLVVGANDLILTAASGETTGQLWRKVTGASLSQAFGASSARLANIIPTPIGGEIFRISNAAASPFGGLISGSPSATSVVYDNDTNEGMFNGLSAYTGSTQWGKIILHNTTRGNSRKIEAVNRTTNTITTESSTDDWADNDVITVQSQVNTYAGYFDIDLSDFIASTVVAILVSALHWNKSGGAVALAVFRTHPYEDRDVGKEFGVYATGTDELGTSQHWVPVISQKITVTLRLLTDHYVSLSIQGTMEYADT